MRRAAAWLLASLAAPLAARADPLQDALVARARGELASAAEALTRALEAEPERATLARELGALELERGDAAAGARWIARALELGDADPEVFELAARASAALGDEAAARAYAARAGTWRGDLIGAALHDRAAAHRASEWTEEASPRGALAALVLASYSGAMGETTTARTLAELAEHLARVAGEGSTLEAAAALRERLDEGGAGAVELAGVVGGSIDYTTNPLFSAERSAGARPYGLRSVLAGELAMSAPISTARLDAALRFEQRLQLLDRERLEGLDLSSLSFAGSVEVPISHRPSAAQLGLSFRIHDLWGDGFTLHWASAFELGARLVLPFDGATRAILGVYGVGVDFIDRSPPDATVSSQNRDRVGQRALVGIEHDAGWFQLRGEAAFTRDDAFGEAFDSRGGVLAARVRAQVVEGLAIDTGISAWLRSFGPVGDAVVLGDAATRLEVRTVAELGAELALSESFTLRVTDHWIRTSGREGHSYTHNALSVGLEAAW